MRPHVEFIYETDLLRHNAELPHGEGEAVQRNLSYDEEDGSASTRIDFLSDWHRPAGLHTAMTEWYVLSGEVILHHKSLGDTALTDGDYLCSPKGVHTPAISVKAGTEILLFREYGDWSFTPSEQHGDNKHADSELVIKRTSEMDWYDVEDPENGSPMDFERGGTPVPGLFIKLLYRDPTTGFYTRLIKCKPGWKEHPLAHHPVYEESYMLDGQFDYNYGSMRKGSYFFRPANVRHGDFVAGEEEGATFLLRCDGDLVDWYTENARVEMFGDPVNWGKDYPESEPPVMLQPVSSKSAGEWENPNYQ